MNDSAELSQRAVASGIVLGPGQLFLTEPRLVGWLRFNAAFSDDERIDRFLDPMLSRERSAFL